MLIANIIYNGNFMFFQHLTSLGFKYDCNAYSLRLSSRAGGELKLINSSEKGKLELTFPQEVTMDDCEKIYQVIESIVEKTEGTVDDANAHIGYDENGKKVFIYHGFSNWSLFIDQAKHKSLEGQKVAVYYADDILGEGILLTYNKENTNDSISCTLITTDGEQTFHGENMEIIPITEW